MTYRKYYSCSWVLNALFFFYNIDPENTHVRWTRNRHYYFVPSLPRGKDDSPKTSHWYQMKNPMRHSWILDSKPTGVSIYYGKVNLERIILAVNFLLWYYFLYLQHFLDLDEPSGCPQNTGRKPCKFPSQQLKQSLFQKLSHVWSHVSVCNSVRPWLLGIYSLLVSLCALKHMALINDPGAKEQGILSWPQFYWISQACFVVTPIN